MILSCPNCATRYTLKDAAMPRGGRTVRCTKCGHNWFASPPEPAAAEAVIFINEATPEPSPASAPPPQETHIQSVAADAAPVDTQIAQAPADLSTAGLAPFGFGPEARPVAGHSRGRRLAVAVGWALLLLSILVVLWSAYRYREQVVGSWPRAASLYAWVGWPVRDGNLILSDVQYGRRVENHHALLVVTGSLRNLSGQRLPVPPLQVLLRDGSGRVVQRYVFTPPVPVLKAGEREAFHTELKSPSPAARHLTLKLAGTTG